MRPPGVRKASRGLLPRDFFWTSEWKRRWGTLPGAAMLYLTEILELPVLDSSGKKIGRVSEVVAALAVRPPRVSMLLLKTAKGQAQQAVPFEHVSALSSDAIRLRKRLLTEIERRRALRKQS